LYYLVEYAGIPVETIFVLEYVILHFLTILANDSQENCNKLNN